MEIKIYQVDAFTKETFKGNPAAVCPLKEWLEDDVLLKVAAENNLSETSFYVPIDDGFEIRWFTPNSEVDLCGHATLATSHVLFNYEGYDEETINFVSPRSGKLTVKRVKDDYTLNFPIDQYSEVDLDELLISTTDKKPVTAFKGKTDYMLIFENEEEILDLKPNLPQIAKLKARGLIVTAKSEKYDFVSRFFGPAVGVNEDPVCGSAHTTLTPYWSQQLGKTEFVAKQLSSRTGILKCALKGDRIELRGNAVLYMKGQIFI